MLLGGSRKLAPRNGVTDNVLGDLNREVCNIVFHVLKSYTLHTRAVIFCPFEDLCSLGVGLFENSLCSLAGILTCLFDDLSCL